MVGEDSETSLETPRCELRRDQRNLGVYGLQIQTLSSPLLREQKGYLATALEGGLPVGGAEGDPGLEATPTKWCRVVMPLLSGRAFV